MTANELETIKNTLKEAKMQTSKERQKLKKQIDNKRYYIKNKKIQKSIAQDQIQVNTNPSTENTNTIELNENDCVENDEILKPYEEHNKIIDYIINKIAFEQFKKTIQEQVLQQLFESNFIKDTMVAQNKLTGHNVIDMTNLGTNNIMDTRQAENKVIELFKIINNKNIKESNTMISEQIKEMTTTELKIFKSALEKTKFETSEKIAKLNQNIYNKRYRINKRKISKSKAQDQIQVNTDPSIENTNGIELNKNDRFFNEKIVKQYKEYRAIIKHIINKIAFEQFKKTIQEQVLKQLFESNSIKDTMVAQNKTNRA